MNGSTQSNLSREEWKALRNLADDKSIGLVERSNKIFSRLFSRKLISEKELEHFIYSFKKATNLRYTNVKVLYQGDQLKQRVNVNDAYSSWKDIFYGVSQGSILGPLLFNIHICNLFYFLDELYIASYADDTAIYTVSEKKSQSLEH